MAIPEWAVDTLVILTKKDGTKERHEDTYFARAPSPYRAGVAVKNRLKANYAGRNIEIIIKKVQKSS